MIDTVSFFHYIIVTLLVIINGLGVSIGQSLIGKAALGAIDTQPQAKGDIRSACVLGNAILETSGLIGFLAAVLLILGIDTSTLPPYAWMAELGIAFTLCIPGLVLGITSSLPAQAACAAIARQPFSSQKILNFMLITQTFIQTPIIFGLVIFLIINNQIAQATTLAQGLRLLACGVSLGLGCIGPAIALGRFSRTSLNSVGINRELYNKVFSFTLISQAIIETPVIFSLAVSLLLTITKIDSEQPLASGIAMICAACCMGIGTLMPSISSGRIASAACREMKASPQGQSELSRISLIAQGLLDTIPIYALLISLMLIIV